jgi:hypothetical protein
MSVRKLQMESFRLHITIVNREKNLGGEFSEKRSIGGLRLLLYWNYD